MVTLTSSFSQIVLHMKTIKSFNLNRTPNLTGEWFIFDRYLDLSVWNQEIKRILLACVSHTRSFRPLSIHGRRYRTGCPFRLKKKSQRDHQAKPGLSNLSIGFQGQWTDSKSPISLSFQLKFTMNRYKLSPPLGFESMQTGMLVCTHGNTKSQRHACFS